MGKSLTSKLSSFALLTGSYRASLIRTLDVLMDIDNAVSAGDKDGIESLSKLQSMIYIIAETEIWCDMDGIDTFIDKYGKDGPLKAADAYLAVGASEIATGLGAIASKLPNADEATLDKTNSFITVRYNYNYESIKKYVETNI